jgi:hypothetical protein
MELSRSYPAAPQGLLYPMMVIAAIAVIVFSILGIASITGWMPHSLVGSGSSFSDTAGTASVTPAIAPEVSRAGPAFQCAECGVIDSIRDIERRGSLWGVPVASAGTAAATEL